MPSVFDKLQLKHHARIVVLGAPPSFEPALAALDDDVEVARSLAEAGEVAFALAFCTRRADLDALSAALVARAPGDPVLWFAYPKGTSKRYTCDFNRDAGWDVLTAAGFRPVRQIAIDADWSALRFRRAAFVTAKRRA